MLSLKTILVTGASRGIGLAVAKHLARVRSQSLQLIVAARDSAALTAIADDLRILGKGGPALEVLPVLMDVGDPSSIDTGLKQVAETFGPPDGLVLSAGIAESAALHKTSDEMFDRIMAINVGGVFRVMRAALPAMLQGGKGRIVVLGSVASKAGAPYISAYCASKHAVLGLVRAAALETAAKGITVNLVCPGYVDTPMTQRSMKNISTKSGLGEEEALVKVLQRTPQNRLFTPQEVAAAVGFLLSDEAAGITGSTLDVDGGELAG